ncbi:MAG: hypothetical protein INF91_01875 [Alphaproteobacteria bacterium]|nr:hypothetical protein [Alphaproteobacteria bacterium]
MSRRIPLWVTLLPLLIGIGAWWLWWRGEADAFKRDVAAVIGASPAMSGFPYRVEGEIGAVALTRAGGGAQLAVSAERAVVNRQPWGSPLVVAHVGAPRLSARADGVQAATLAVEAPSANVSLRWQDARLARLSMVFDEATLRLGLLPAPLSGKVIELHVRETPATADPASQSPKGPQQAQLVIEGQGVRAPGGDPVTLSADFALTGPRPVRAVADWLSGGTLELRRLTLADATGEVVSATATAAPDRAGQLLIAGTLTTVCPRTVAALFAGQPAPAEYRARRARSFAFEGPPGAVRLALPAGALDRIAERRQDPRCPKLG